MTVSVSIWSVALFVYFLFLAWHENWRGPLQPAEIDAYLKRLEARETMSPATRAVIEDFMRRDTGRAFLMVNLIKFPDGTVPHPDTGSPIAPQALLLSYFRPFMK